MCDETNDDNDLYKYGLIDEKRLRVSVDDWRDIWSWKKCKTRPSYWFKHKPSYKSQNNYEYYTICINGNHCKLSRVIYKLYNPKWKIEDVSSDNIIDHINVNSLDNRIENLRILNNQQNQWNNDARGTRFQKRSGKWSAHLMCNGIRYYGTSRDTEQEAYEDRLLLKEKYHVLPE